ncbi:MAG: hypothetical protein F6K26_43135 [Moorea sp. SIO2I5]|nr:hypothetical protein [Moorena sp. SIO2I5]
MIIFVPFSLSLFPVPCSLFPVPCSLWYIPIVEITSTDQFHFRICPFPYLPIFPSPDLDNRLTRHRYLNHQSRLTNTTMHK